MIRSAAILLFILLAAAARSQADSAGKTPYTLKGTVISELRYPPHCGIFAFAMPIEMSVLEFSDSAYKPKKALVIVECPELYGPGFFKTDSTYLLTVAYGFRKSSGFTVADTSLLEKYKGSAELWITGAKKSSSNTQAAEPEEVYITVDRPAQFPGGTAAMKKYIAAKQAEADDPKAKCTYKITGNVYIKLTVEKDGSLSDIHVLKGINSCSFCNAEALSIISSMPKWTPALLNGKAVRSACFLLVTYKP